MYALHYTKISVVEVSCNRYTINKTILNDIDSETAAIPQLSTISTYIALREHKFQTSSPSRTFL